MQQASSGVQTFESPNSQYPHKNLNVPQSRTLPSSATRHINTANESISLCPSLEVEQANQPSSTGSYHHESEAASSQQCSPHTSSGFPNLPQLDGPNDHHVPPAFQYHHRRQQQVSNPIGPRPPSRSRSTTTARINTFTYLLPFCVAEGRLTEAQVIGLSDLAGNLKEVMLLALRAQVDEEVAEALERAVGEEAAHGIVEFFRHEFEG